MMQCWWMQFPLCPWGWRQGVTPATALHIAGAWKGNPPFIIVALAMAIAIAIAIAISVAIADSVAITVAVGHGRCGCRQPSLPPSLLRGHQPSPSPFPLPLSIAVSITIGHCSCHLRRPSPLPSPLAISESCCLGMARIVFDKLKQRMLTLFYFVWTVGGALIKAGWLTRCLVAMANTSVGRQAASIELLVREVAGSRGAPGGTAGWRRWLTMGGVVLLCCWGIIHWQMAFVMMCWMW